MLRGETSTKGNLYETQSHASPMRYELTPPDISYHESVLNYKPKCVVKKKDEDFIVRTELQKPDDWNEVQNWGKRTKLICEDIKKYKVNKRFKSIRVIFDSGRKHHAIIHYNLKEDQRYIYYNDDSENEMRPITEIIKLPFFCKLKSELLKQIAEVSNEHATGISFPVTNHYTDARKHVLLWGLVPERYKDATKHFAQCRLQSVVTSLIDSGISSFDQRLESPNFLKSTADEGDAFYGPFYDGQLEIFALLYYVLETQDLVNFEATSNLEKCKQILSFLFDKLNTEDDSDLRKIDKYVEFVETEILESRNNRMRLPKEKGISSTLLFWIKKNYVKILNNTDTAYHDHWHNLMRTLGLHHYRCPHTYNEIMHMYNHFLNHYLPVYKRNCVSPDSETDVDVRDVFRLYSNFKNNMPPSVNHSINDLLNAFSYNLAKFLFKTNHHNRKLEKETVNCYLNELHCPIKNLGLIVDFEPESEVLKLFKIRLIENINFLAFLNRKKCPTFEIPADNNLSLAIQRLLEKALSFNLIASRGNTPIKWNQIEATIKNLKNEKFANLNSREINQNVDAFDGIGNDMETEEADARAHVMIKRYEKHEYDDFKDCEFKYHEEEITPTVCVGCCYGKKKVNRYLILNDGCVVAFCTWCTWCLNYKYSEYISELLDIVQKKYENPIFLDQMNQRITYAALEEIGEFAPKTYNRIKNLIRRESSRFEDKLNDNNENDMEYLSDEMHSEESQEYY